MLKLVTGDDPRKQDIVDELERLLVLAKAGEIEGLFAFTEYADGAVAHSRVGAGMCDSLVIFWCEVIKKRVLRDYC